MEHTKEKRNLPARQDDIRARHIKRQKKKRKRKRRIKWKKMYFH